MPVFSDLNWRYFNAGVGGGTDQQNEGRGANRPDLWGRFGYSSAASNTPTNASTPLPPPTHLPRRSRRGPTEGVWALAPRPRAGPRRPLAGRGTGSPAAGRGTGTPSCVDPRSRRCRCRSKGAGTHGGSGRVGSVVCCLKAGGVGRLRRARGCDGGRVTPGTLVVHGQIMAAQILLSSEYQFQSPHVTDRSCLPLPLPSPSPPPPPEAGGGGQLGTRKSWNRRRKFGTKSSIALEMFGQNSQIVAQERA